MRRQASIDAALRDKLVMRAGLNTAPVRHHEDPVGLANSRKAVGDHNDGALAGQTGDRSLDAGFALGVERAGRLVEQQERRVRQQRPREGDTLALAA